MNLAQLYSHYPLKFNNDTFSWSLSYLALDKYFCDALAEWSRKIISNDFWSSILWFDLSLWKIIYFHYLWWFWVRRIGALRSWEASDCPGTGTTVNYESPELRMEMGFYARAGRSSPLSHPFLSWNSKIEAALEKQKAMLPLLGMQGNQIIRWSWNLYSRYISAICTVAQTSVWC